MQDASIKFHAKDFITRRQCEGLESCYRLGRFLGEGAYGAVHSCTHLETGAERAVKIMEKSEANAEMNQEVIDEYNILKELDHPNLIKVYELLEDEDAFYIVTDLCEGGDMLDELTKHEEFGGALSEPDAALLVNNVLSCINYCHSKNLMHRDLKLENILLHDSDYNDIKIIDFGLARNFRENTRFSDVVGTAYYMAPEVLDCNYGYKVDLWACGVIAYMVLGGYAPFEGDNDREILEAIAEGEYDFNDETWDDVSDLAKDFVASLLVEEEDRPTAEEALKHPWLANHRATCLCENRRASTRASLASLSSFHSRGSILKQATCAMMASQLQHCKDVKDFGRAFQALDQNCCGKLTKDDLRSSMAALSDSDDSSDNDSQEFDIDGLFEQVNISGTGTIHYSEWVGACLLQKNVLGDDDKLWKMFKTYDKDNKGYITLDDLKDVLMTRNSLVSERTIEKIMSQTDTSGTGKITFDDFCSKMSEHPQPVAPATVVPRKAHQCVQRTKLPMLLQSEQRARRSICQVSAKVA